MYTTPLMMIGVEISSFLVLGHTESFGFVSNSHSFFPVSASYPRTQPSPCGLTTCTISPTLATAIDAHWPCRMFSLTELSSHASFPVFLSTAMMEGALGEGTCT